MDQNLPKGSIRKWFNTFIDKAWEALAFTRIPGNAFSFWIRQTLHWSRGKSKLHHESKVDLFEYLRSENTQDEKKAKERSRELARRYHFENLENKSIASLYRKNLYIVDTLEKATQDLPLPFLNSITDSRSKSLPPIEPIFKALDIGAQDWHYVFGLEKWLKYSGNPRGRKIALKGIELDGHGIYPDFHSRKDHAEAYIDQTENPLVKYIVEDFLKFEKDVKRIQPENRKLNNLVNKEEDSGYDFVSIFYPFVKRYQLLLWGLPLRYYSPKRFIDHAVELVKKDGWLLVYCHTQEEHDIFLEIGKGIVTLELLRQGPVESNLVDFWEDVTDRKFSIWRKK